MIFTPSLLFYLAHSLSCSSYLLSSELVIGLSSFTLLSYRIYFSAMSSILICYLVILSLCSQIHKLCLIFCSPFFLGILDCNFYLFLLLFPKILLVFTLLSVILIQLIYSHIFCK